MLVIESGLGEERVLFKKNNVKKAKELLEEVYKEAKGQGTIIIKEGYKLGVL